MILSLIRYEYQNKKKEFVALVLGKSGEKLVMILDENIKNEDIKKIKENYERINTWTLYNKVKWFKENVPSSYRGYKEMYLSRIKIIEYKKLME